MKEKRLVTVILALILLVSQLPANALNTELPLVEYPNRLQRSHQTQIDVFIDPSFSNSSAITEELHFLDGRRFSNQITRKLSSINQLSIDYQTIEHHDRNEMISYLHTIEEYDGSPNGHSFNETAYEEGLLNELYTNTTGRSYDADKTVDWIANNLWDGNDTKFSLYLFNFTELDRGLDHWFTIRPQDVDTGKMQTTFFSKTSGLIHGKAVSAWGGYQGLPIHFIDFSSETWFGDFINIVWSQYGFLDTILSQKIQDFADTSIRDEWLADFVYSFIITTYDLQLLDDAPIGHSIEIETVVFYDWYSYNISMEEARSMISSPKIDSTFTTAFPWIEFNITDQWYSLSEFAELEQIINENRIKQSDGTYHIQIYGEVLDYLETELIPQLFDDDRSSIVLPSLVFFLDHATFVAGTIPIAGISRPGYQLQGLTPQKYFVNGEQQQGFSEVLLHEGGHGLGLQHPFYVADLWAGDFSASVMGYYSGAPDFSIYDVNTLGYFYSDYYLIQAEYLQTNTSGDNLIYEAIDAWIASAQNAQQAWEFKESITHAQQALCGYDYLFNTSLTLCEKFDIEDLVRSYNSVANPGSDLPFGLFGSSTNTASASISIPLMLLLPVMVAILGYRSSYHQVLDREHF